ncbi:MAG TPA: PH domain-containing protein, partial [Thermoplasmata archaeon]|nr:PH domain-containing protein [Thermoplasmata archaeon]
MASFCPKCGQPVGPGDAFCKSCGASLLAGPSGLPPPPPPSPAAGGMAPAPPMDMGIPPLPTPTDLPFHLQADESLLKEIRPGVKLLWRFILGGVITGVVFVVLGVLLFAFLAVAGGAAGGLLLFGMLGGIGLILMVASVITGYLAYTKFRFWITTQRTVGRRGVVSYSIDSVPLETISDVIISRSIVDRLLGLSSLYIQPFGGAGFYPAQSGRYGSQFQSANTFPGLPSAEAPQIQQLILHLRD